MRKLALIAAATVATAATYAWAEEAITVVSWGGAYSDSQRKAYYEPFMKETGTKITEEEYNGEIAKIRAMVEAGSITWDVIDVDSFTGQAACAEGVLETIDWGKLGLDRSKFIGEFVSDCTVPTIVYSTVFAYDSSKLSSGPATVNDLFDLEKFPGKRGLQKSPTVNLEWALIADGVAKADVYKVLGTPEGLDRAFAKLDTIKKDVVWWEAGAQPPQLLADGQVVMTSAWNGRIQNAIDNDKKPFKIVWDHNFYDWDLWAITKGTPRLETAYKFLAYASSPGPQAEQTKHIAYGPANPDAIPNVNPAALPNLPTAPENYKQAVLLDTKFWADNGDALRERFNAWLAK
jgi:putative spermidine/putrescine transport system substrate-binding protein